MVGRCIKSQHRLIDKQDDRLSKPLQPRNLPGGETAGVIHQVRKDFRLRRIRTAPLKKTPAQSDWAADLTLDGSRVWETIGLAGALKSKETSGALFIQRSDYITQAPAKIIKLDEFDFQVSQAALLDEFKQRRKHLHNHFFRWSALGKLRPEWDGRAELRDKLHGRICLQVRQAADSSYMTCKMKFIHLCIQG